MRFNVPPWMVSGAQSELVFFRCSGKQPESQHWNRAPISDRGVKMRFMGRLRMEASPFKVAWNRCPVKMPEISRRVVPLFPTSRIWLGADSPWSPLPWTRTLEPSFSMEMPSWRKQEMVDRQSAPWRKFVTSVSPLEMAPNIMPLWEMDLSPGTESSPRKACVLVSSIVDKHSFRLLFVTRLALQMRKGGYLS